MRKLIPDLAAFLRDHFAPLPPATPPASRPAGPPQSWPGVWYRDGNIPH